MTSAETKRVANSLAAWGRAIDRSITGRSPDVCARLAGVILGQLPRHLPTYRRLLQLCWEERRWAEGEEWARRLLQADPGNPLAWRALCAGGRGRRRPSRGEHHLAARIRNEPL